jgi:hypothetical protein
MNKTTRFASIKLQLAALGFRDRKGWGHLDSQPNAEGWLRVCIEEGDDRLDVYRFDKNQVTLWNLTLSIHLPEPVLAASLGSALADIGAKWKTGKRLAA